MQIHEPVWRPRIAKERMENSISVIRCPLRFANAHADEIWIAAAIDEIWIDTATDEILIDPPNNEIGGFWFWP